MGESAVKRLCFGLLIGFLVGIWFGINIGKDRVFYDNPLRDNTLTGGDQTSSLPVLFENLS